MRFKSKTKAGYTIYAVTGTNTVSFAIDFTKADTTGMLGFSVQRSYPPGEELLYLPGFKIFEEEYKKEGNKPNPDMIVSTKDHPVQSFVWDDFTLKPGQRYTYRFCPMTGEPGSLQEGPALDITVETEALFGDDKHDVFFNRGVASSQAYAREFHNAQPDELVGKEQKDAFDWLGRDLHTALYKFIGQAGPGDKLLACYYEFHYQPVLDAFKEAISRGADVEIIIDAKQNGSGEDGDEDEDEDGTKAKEAFPRETNLATIKNAKIPMSRVTKRENNPNFIQHNKFMVYLKGGELSGESAVFTGSVNLSENGIFGHTNVGHWVRGDKNVAEKYVKYWELLKADPGAEKRGDRSANTQANKEYKNDVAELTPNVTAADLPKGITCIFSPRPDKEMLTEYFQMVDDSSMSSAITLAFGVNAELKDLLKDNNASSPITFMVLEKEDKATKKNQKTFVNLTAANNVYEAFGSYIKDPLYNWVKETNAQQMNMHADHVIYIHSKFMIQDPLGDTPVVATGSANFSAASTVSNDENMILVKGDTRVADIYFTEFNRLFNHYYFRSMAQKMDQGGNAKLSKVLFLDTTDGWQKNYAKGKLRRKRVDMYVKMTGTKTL